MQTWHPSRQITLIAILISSLFIWLLTDIGTISAQVADPYITKDNGQNTYTHGQAISYTIVVTNPSSSTITDLGVVDYPPSALSSTSYVSYSTGGATGNTSGTVAITDTVTMPPSSTITYLLSATVATSSTELLSNTAYLVVPNGITGNNTANDVATDSDSYSTLTDPYVTKSNGIETVAPGQSVTYTITVKNPGPLTVDNLQIIDNPPAALTDVTFISISSKWC